MSLHDPTVAASNDKEAAAETTTTISATAPIKHDFPKDFVDKDAALVLVGEDACTIDPAAATRVLRKIDWFFMPAMLLGDFSDSSSITLVLTFE